MNDFFYYGASLKDPYEAFHVDPQIDGLVQERRNSSALAMESSFLH